MTEQRQLKALLVQIGAPDLAFVPTTLPAPVLASLNVTVADPDEPDTTWSLVIT